MVGRDEERSARGMELVSRSDARGRVLVIRGVRGRGRGNGVGAERDG